MGSSETRLKAIQYTRRGGTCVFLGFATPELTINFSEIIRHQKKLVGSFVYSQKQYKKAIELALMCDESWVKNITFEEVADHLEDFCSGNFENIKVALRPNA